MLAYAGGRVNPGGAGPGPNAAPESSALPNRHPAQSGSRSLGLRSLVNEPVVHHELNPCRRQQIQDRRRLELIPCHQLAADDARVGDQQWRCPGRCARAARSGRTGRRPSPSAGNEIVQAAVGRARLANRGIKARRECPDTRTEAPRYRADSWREADCESGPDAGMARKRGSLFQARLLNSCPSRSVKSSAMTRSRHEWTPPSGEGRRIEHAHDFGEHCVCRSREPVSQVESRHLSVLQHEQFMDVVRMCAPRDLVLEEVANVGEQVAILVDVGVEEHLVRRSRGASGSAGSCLCCGWT